MNDPSTPSSSPAPALVPPLPLAARPTPARPPRRFAFGTLVTVALLSAGLAVATTSLVGRDRHAADAHRPGASDLVTTYQCPMHPSIVQDHPGQCPICGMTLVKVEKSPARTEPGKAPRGEPRILFYRSPMDARQTSPVPRKDEMGMDYLPVYESKAAVKSSVPGLTTVEIDPDRQQLIGLKITEVTRGPVGGAWRTVGRIAMDETRVRHVNLKVPGFVEQIYVDFIGKKVRKGDRLFSLYSPELLASHEEYLLAFKTRGALAKAGDATAQNDSADGSTLVAAARRKLALWDISEAEIDRVASTGAPTKTLTIYAPVGGVVTKKDVVEGMKLEAGAMPYEIVDLSSVWVLADVYESELRFVKPNMTATYGLSIDDANTMVMTAVGGDNQTVTVEGRERYGIKVRYARDFREDLPALRRVLLPLPGGQGQIPMEEIADVVLAHGPSMIRNENGLLAGYVYVDFDTAKIDVGHFVEQAKRAVTASVTVPTGYSMAWSGQYENMIRVKERLKVVLPLTVVLIFALLYMNTKSAFKATIVMLAVPFSAVGAVWLLTFLGYNVSIAVWVGMIALMGLDAETGVFMLLFLDLSYDERKRNGKLNGEPDLVEAIIHGAVKRVRPKAMTVCAAMLGMLPIMWSTGTGADLMKRIAAPMVGGLVTSFLMELLVYPPIYFLWKRRHLAPDRDPARAPVPGAAASQPGAF